VADYKKNWKYFSGFLIHDVPSDSSMLYPKSLATAICLFYTLSGALPWLHRCPSLIWAVVSNGRLHGHFVGWTVEEPVQTCPGQHGTLPALGQPVCVVWLAHAARNKAPGNLIKTLRSCPAGSSFDCCGSIEGTQVLIQKWKNNILLLELFHWKIMNLLFY
jgi:hypothetical protein